MVDVTEPRSCGSFVRSLHSAGIASFGVLFCPPLPLHRRTPHTAALLRSAPFASVEEFAYSPYSRIPNTCSIFLRPIASLGDLCASPSFLRFHTFVLRKLVLRPTHSPADFSRWTTDRCGEISCVSVIPALLRLKLSICARFHVTPAGLW